MRIKMKLFSGSKRSEKDIGATKQFFPTTVTFLCYSKNKSIGSVRWMQQHILRISNYDRNGVKLNRIKNNEHHFNVNLLTYSALACDRKKFSLKKIIKSNLYRVARSLLASRTFRRFQFHIGKWLKFNIYWRRYVGANYWLYRGVKGSSIATLVGLLIFHQLAKGNWKFPERKFHNSLRNVHNPHKSSFGCKLDSPERFYVASNFTSQFFLPFLRKNAFPTWKSFH